MRIVSGPVACRAGARGRCGTGSQDCSRRGGGHPRLGDARPRRPGCRWHRVDRAAASAAGGAARARRNPVGPRCPALGPGPGGRGPASRPPRRRVRGNSRRGPRSGFCSRACGTAAAVVVASTPTRHFARKKIWRPTRSPNPHSPRSDPPRGLFRGANPLTVHTYRTGAENVGGTVSFLCAVAGKTAPERQCMQIGYPRRCASGRGQLVFPVQCHDRRRRCVQ